MSTHNNFPIKISSQSFSLQRSLHRELHLFAKTFSSNLSTKKCNHKFCSKKIVINWYINVYYFLFSGKSSKKGCRHRTYICRHIWHMLLSISPVYVMVLLQVSYFEISIPKLSFFLNNEISLNSSPLRKKCVAVIEQCMNKMSMA